ncbi:MAG: hypothetical protein KDH20_05460 [Rhodocyclaceae bacterium]|nr:hypothetical protein [Rhodocyclaceae bacterium]
MSNRPNPTVEARATSPELTPECINSYIVRAHQMRSEELSRAFAAAFSAPRRLLERFLARRRKPATRTVYS